LAHNTPFEGIRVADAIQGAHFWLDRQLRAERLALDAARAELHALEEERHRAGKAERQRRNQVQEGTTQEREAAAKL
jgi:hypothetical protein